MVEVLADPLDRGSGVRRVLPPSPGKEARIDDVVRKAQGGGLYGIRGEFLSPREQNPPRGRHRRRPGEASAEQRFPHGRSERRSSLRSGLPSVFGAAQPLRRTDIDQT
jgi:hypothetical protein